jgi:D-3-phosphoglycerate dehydrogenase
MNELRFAIIGDDFTPAILFKKALTVSLEGWKSSIVYRTIDITPDKMTPYASAEIHEAFGNPADVIDLAHDAHILVTTFAPVTSFVISRLEQLLAIGCGRGGPVNINISAANERGIPVLNAPGRNAQAVAEFTIAGMMNLMRQIPIAIDYVRSGDWKTPREDTFEKPSGPELGGKVVGLIGFGQVGRLVANLLKAFGARVLVYDPFIDMSSVVKDGIEVTDLSRLLADAQVISIHARLEKGEPPLLGTEHFAMMKQTPYLINTSRATALDHVALLNALDTGLIRAAFLDVYNEEPLPLDNPLLKVKSSKLFLTPHSAGVSHDVPVQTARIIAQGITSLVTGQRQHFVINPEAIGTFNIRIDQIT